MAGELVIKTIGDIISKGSCAEAYAKFLGRLRGEDMETMLGSLVLERMSLEDMELGP